MSFARPDLLWLVLALPAMAALGVWGFARRRRRVARLFGEAGLVARLGGADLARFPTPRLLLIAGAALALGLAAAGPRWGTREVEARSRSLNLVFAVDVSRSMLAADVAPNRLERQRLLLGRLLRELRGDRVGLVAFAGRAYILSPLTTDYGVLQLNVDALDPEILSQGGSAISAAIRQSTNLLRTQAGQGGGDMAIVLITDGEPTEDDSVLEEAITRARAAGVVIHTFGIGTTQGAPVPDLDPATGRLRGYKRDADGEIFISRLDEAWLARIARDTGGRYVSWSEAGATERILQAVRGMERGATSDGRRTEPHERFAWFVAIAIGLLALDWVRFQRPPAPIGHASRRGAGPATAASRGAAASSGAARNLLLFLLIGSALAFGPGDLERGNRYYREGRYAEAAEAYRRALRDGRDSPQLQYNLGTALLRLGQREEGEAHLRRALTSVDPAMRTLSHYNLGNRFLEAGRASSDAGERGRHLDAAIEAYKQALRIDPSDPDAKWNLELALREREETPPDPQAGGGGDDQDEQDQDSDDQEGGEGGDRPASAEDDPSSGDSPSGGQGPLSREQAERILGAAEQDERDLYRRKLREGRRESPVARDW